MLDAAHERLLASASLAGARGVLYTCRGCGTVADGPALERDRAEYERRLVAASGSGDYPDTDDLRLNCAQCDGYDLVESRVDVAAWLHELMRLRAGPLGPVLDRVRATYTGKARRDHVGQIAAMWAAKHISGDT